MRNEASVRVYVVYMALLVLIVRSRLIRQHDNGLIFIRFQSL